MGSFNVSCALSGMPIVCDEEVKLAFLVQNSGKTLSASAYFSLLTPCFVDAKYDDYGRFDIIADDKTNSLLMNILTDMTMIGKLEDDDHSKALESMDDVFDNINTGRLYSKPSRFQVSYNNSYHFENSRLVVSSVTPSPVSYMAIKKSIFEKMCGREVVINEPVYNRKDVYYKNMMLRDLIHLDIDINESELSDKIKKHLIISSIVNKKQYIDDLVPDQCIKEIEHEIFKYIGGDTKIIQTYMFFFSKSNMSRIISDNIHETLPDECAIFEDIIDKYQIDYDTGFSKILVDALITNSSCDTYHDIYQSNSFLELAYHNSEDTKILYAYAQYLSLFLHKYFTPSTYAGQEIDTDAHNILYNIFVEEHNELQERYKDYDED